MRRKRDVLQWLPGTDIVTFVGRHGKPPRETFDRPKEVDASPVATPYPTRAVVAMAAINPNCYMRTCLKGERCGLHDSPLNSYPDFPNVDTTDCRI
jgi:hypothetical protein